MKIRWIDACKCIGIILVYYGHAVERFGDAGIQSGFSQWVYIYSFHMPMFFILSGYVHPTIISNRIDFLKKKIKRIVGPIIFFNILFCFLFMAERLYNDGSIDLYFDLKNLLITVFWGNELYCALTWFLCCIICVYVLHAVFSHFLKNKKIIAIFIVVIGVFGYCITSSDFGSLRISQFLGVWYFDEAFVAYSFFLMGNLLRSLENDFPNFVMVGLITVGSIAIVTPIVELFSRYIPILTGAYNIEKKNE